MASISQLRLPDNTVYNIKGSIHTVIGTQTASTGAWTGNLTSVDSLYDGLTIAYYLPYTGSGNATLNLTLKNGTSGAVNCYTNGNTRLAAQYEKGSVIYLTYFSAGSIKVNGVDTTDNRWITHADVAGSGGSGESGDAVSYDISYTTIGSASAGTSISADDITAWSAGTLPSLTVASTTVVTAVTTATGTAASAAITNGVLTITNSSIPLTSVTVNTASIGSASGWSAGTTPSLTYTAKTIPNISVSSVTVVSDLTPTGTLLPNVEQDSITRGLVIS